MPLLAWLCAVLLSSIVLADDRENSTSPFIATKAHRYVCVIDYFTIDTCPHNNSTSVDDFTGFEPELFKKVADVLYRSGKLEWAPGNWSFVCTNDLEFSASIAELNKVDDPTRLCDLFMNGLTADELADYDDLSISAAEYESGRRILIYNPPRKILWDFLQPFEWCVWLMIFGTSVVIALSLFFLEWTWHHGYSFKRAPSSSQAWRGYSSLQWGVTGQSLSSVYQLTPRSPGGRVVVLTSAFAAFILALAYASAYTSRMSMRSILSNVKSISDLQNLPVGIWEEDLTAIRKLGALNRLVLLPWNNMESDVDQMLNMLRNGTIAALVIDAPFVAYESSANCDMYQVGPLILPSGMGVIFAAGTPPSYSLAIDNAITSLASRGVVSELMRQYLIFSSSDCPSKGLEVGDNGLLQTRLQDVGGLCIFLAGCIGLGLIWNIASIPLRRFASPTLSSRTMKPCDEPKLAPCVADEVRLAYEAVQSMALKSGKLPDALEAVIDNQMGQLRDELLTIVKYASKFTSNMATKELMGGPSRPSPGHGPPTGASQKTSGVGSRTYIKRYDIKRNHTEPGEANFEESLNKAKNRQLSKEKKLEALRQDSGQVMFTQFAEAQGKIRHLMVSHSEQLGMERGSPELNKGHLSRAIKEGAIQLEMDIRE